MKDFKSILEKYHFTDELGHALENCVDYQELLDVAKPSERMCFVSDDDGHDYLIPAAKREAFSVWLEHEHKLWEPGLSDEEFKRIEAEYTGEDFNDYRTGTSPESYTFERPEAI
jgi:hypothetical protein